MSVLLALGKDVEDGASGDGSGSGSMWSGLLCSHVQSISQTELTPFMLGDLFSSITVDAQSCGNLRVLGGWIPAGHIRNKCPRTLDFFRMLQPSLKLPRIWIFGFYPRTSEAVFLWHFPWLHSRYFVTMNLCKRARGSSDLQMARMNREGLATCIGPLLGADQETGSLATVLTHSAVCKQSLCLCFLDNLSLLCLAQVGVPAFIWKEFFVSVRYIR